MNLVISVALFFPFIFLSVGVNEFVSASYFTDFFNPALSKAPRYPDSRLYVTPVGLESVSGTVECFGDFNSDKYTDVFILGTDRRTVTVYLWNYEEFKYEKSSATFTEDNPIDNLVAGDFNYDGKLDVLVFGYTDANDNATQTWSKIHVGDHTTFISSYSIPDTSNVDGHFLVMDYNADLKIDLFGSKNNQRTWWKNQGDGTFAVERLPTPSPLLRPNSHAFVDIDGDCLSDLVITSCAVNSTSCEKKQIEIGINKKGANNVFFEFAPAIPIPRGAGQIGFLDLDGDGTTDILMPVCWPTPNCTEDNYILMSYNVQKPLCTGLFDSEDKCRQPTNLCVADPAYKFGVLDTNENSEDTVVVPAAMFGDKHFLWQEDLPITLRTGDYNLDGYPDILVPLQTETGNTIELWASVACTEALCGAAATAKNRRTFAKVTAGVDDLTSITTAKAAAFIDFGENGMEDIVVLCNNNSIVTIYNNFFNDAFFLKTMGSNGVCPSFCSTGPKFPSPKPYGVNFPGAVFKFTYSELDGTKRVTEGVQLRQSGYLALQTPYNLFGLGRTSNYIEQIYLGVSINHDPHWHMWITVIPNSQLVGFPYKPDDPDEWTLELYIKLSGVTLWAVVAVISWLIVTAGLIWFFKWREKRQDELKKQETAHLFSFDAL